MTRIILLVTLTSALILLAAEPSFTQINMACGPGVILRSDNSLIIDGYTIYPQPFAGSVPGQVSKDNKTSPGPTSITLGRSLIDDTKVCIETDSGSHCISLKTIRTLK